MTIEQRLHPRIPMQEDTIYFSVISTDTPQPNGNSEIDRIHYPGTITDISRGGVGMRVSSPHHLGEEIWLEGIEGNNAPRPGRIRWMSHDEGSDQFNIGIQLA